MFYYLIVGLFLALAFGLGVALLLVCLKWLRKH